jgi:zinc protease
MNAATRLRHAEVEEVVTATGLRAYLVQAMQVPFVAVDFAFRGGAATDPDGQEGLASMVSGLLDEGAGPYDSKAFRAELEDNAIRLSFDADKQTLAGDLRTLNTTREHAFELLRLALAEPRFDPEPVERVRAQMQADLARRESDPGARAQRAWFKAAFPDHPYGRPSAGTPESVARLPHEALRPWTRRHLNRRNLVIAVAGAITPEALAPLLDHAFGGLPAGEGPFEVPAAAPFGPRLVVEPLPIPQSIVIFGHAGLGHDDPDYYPAQIVNYLLGGGGFSSRFMEEVREKRGLAYSVHAQLQDLERAPLWLGMVATSNERVGESLRLIRAETARMAAGEIEEGELADARTYLTGSFPLRLTSNEQVAGMLLTMQLRRLGRDYLERRNALIEAVTLADVRRAAARLLHADRLIVAAAGQPVGLEV